MKVVHSMLAMLFGGMFLVEMWRFGEGNLSSEKVLTLSVLLIGVMLAARWALDSVNTEREWHIRPEVTLCHDGLIPPPPTEE